MTRGGIASEHALASSIGADILKEGGNAVDAAIATTLAVGTLNPYHSCIGGGGFAIVRSEGGVMDTVDFRVTAPFYATAPTSLGGSAVGVPGEVRGLKALHDKFGKLDWARLFAPSIALARGMPMGKDLYDYLRLECRNAPSIEGSWIASDPEFVQTFTRDGKLIPEGETWSRPSYAETLEAIASDAEAFYQGRIAESIARAVQDRGGLMTTEDLKQYKPVWGEPLSTQFRGHTVYAPRTPASGGILLSALGTLNALPPPEPTASVTDAEEAHRTIEALRMAYGQRTLLGDPAFVPGMDEVQAALVTEEAGRARAAKVGDKTHPPEFYLAAAPAIDHGTSHITAADENGVVCSLTTTIGQLFASRIMVPGTGIMLNDSMDDFSVEGKSNHFGYAPSVANFVMGGKRPLSSQCPYIIEWEGQVVFAGGSAGGATIISANVQVIRNIIDHGMSAREALSAPRLHDMVLPDKTQLEQDTLRGGPVVGFSEALAQDLEARGHNIEWIVKSMSTPSAIRVLPDGWDAAGDPRKYDAGGAVA